MICIPSAPRSLQKDIPLKQVLGKEAIDCLANNISFVHAKFKSDAFRQAALNNLEPLGVLDRGKHLAKSLRQYLPQPYPDAIDILLASLTPPLTRTDNFGLAVFFYLPHIYFVSEYGLDFFEKSMQAQYELTKRFSAEFSIRPFLIQQQERTLSKLIIMFIIAAKRKNNMLLTAE